MDDDSKWRLKFMLLPGTVTVIVDARDGEILKVSTDQQ